MKQKITNVVLLVVVLGLAAWGLKTQMRLQEIKRDHPAINDYAIMPDQFIENAHRDLNRHYYKTVHADLEKAIASMRLVETDKSMDDDSREVIERSIRNLEKITQDIDNGEVNYDEIRLAFSNALISLAYAQLRVAQQLNREGTSEEVVSSLGFSMKHLRNASRYSDKVAEEIELSLARNIDSLVLHLDEFDTRSSEEMLQKLVEELDKTLLKHDE